MGLNLNNGLKKLKINGIIKREYGKFKEEF
jgi:hypothetical protein